ncbi:lipoyl(octanoyl) transferase LipB [bacterium]|nr:lipoyl(octanoyl) transferase LipB [bacterium]
MIQMPYAVLSEARYKPVWDLQEKIMAYNLEQKKLAKNSSEPAQTISTFLLCEHLPVYTLGKSGHLSNLKLNESQLQEKDIDYWHINRGGDITYHGPGQITGYPIFDLEKLKPSASWFIDTLEEAIIDTLLHFNIVSQIIEGLPGVWIKGKTEAEDRKICAIGVKMSRWISIHGFALNVSTDLSYFNHIIPCGIEDKGVTSISQELGREVSIAEVNPILLAAFEKRFGIQFNKTTLDALNQMF